MFKTKKKQLQEKLSLNGKVWVKKPSMNYRQSSGVEFRGVYMTPEEILQEARRSELLKKVSIKGDE